MKRHPSYLSAVRRWFTLAIWMVAAGIPASASGAQLEDFVTGGGTLLTNQLKGATFAVVGGLKSGEYWGSLNYKADKDVFHLAESLQIKSSDLLSYCLADSTGVQKRILIYTVRVNNVPGHVAKLEVSVLENPPSGHPGWEMDCVVYATGASCRWFATSPGRSSSAPWR